MASRNQSASENVIWYVTVISYFLYYFFTEILTGLRIVLDMKTSNTYTLRMKDPQGGRRTYQFSVVLEPDTDEGGFVARIPSLPGCTSQGETFEEALINIKEATELYLEALIEDGKEIPIETAASIITPIAVTV